MNESKQATSQNTETGRKLKSPEPIMNPLLVAAFYGERVTTLSVIGCVIVVCSIIGYNIWLARRKGNEFPAEPAG